MEKNSWNASKHQRISLLREYQGKSKHQGMEDQSLGALGAFRQPSEFRKIILGMRNPIVRMASHDLSNVSRDGHSMDQYRSRLKLSENFEPPLVQTNFGGNSYGAMAWKFPPTLVLVHGWLFPGENHNSWSNSRSDSRNCCEPTRKIFICPCILGAFFQELGWSPRGRFKQTITCKFSVPELWVGNPICWQCKDRMCSQKRVF